MTGADEIHDVARGQGAGAALEGLPGVKRVAVSLEHAEARVDFDDSKTTTDRLIQTIGLLGFRARLKAVEKSS